ncbi:MAG: AMP phosphorylase [Candidatus Ranarchaeia archaeon]
MKYKAKIIDIASNVKRILVNQKDAQSRGLRVYDRVKVKAGKNWEIAVVDVTSTFIQPGVIGIFRNLQPELGVKDGQTVEITAAALPETASFIRKKMRNNPLSKEEIYRIVRDIVDERLDPLEIAGFLAAQYYVGMSDDEVEYLTRAIAESGDQIDFERPVFDKHSIGGVPGNKVSLVIVPLVASAGLLIPKTSSRAITSPSGTADTMEVLADVEFGIDEIKKIVKKTNGLICWGGALTLAPADDLLIQVERPMLIDPRSQMLASIMAKKVSMGVDFLVLDLPIGKGTKVEHMKEARSLSNAFISLGERLGMRVECGITYGGQPVGHAVGPALEAREGLLVLSDKGPQSVAIKSAALAGVLYEMAGLAGAGEGKQKALEMIRNGKALAKFREIIEAQGGDPGVKPEDIPVGPKKISVKSPINGFIAGVDNRCVGLIARTAGAPLEKGAGLNIIGKRGMYVKKGDTILEIFAEKASKLKAAHDIAMKNPPITIEGMLLERIGKKHDISL